MSNLLQFVIGFCFLIVTLSLSYYFVYHLPQIEEKEEIVRNNNDCRDRAEGKISSSNRSVLSGSTFLDGECWMKYSIMGSDNSILNVIEGIYKGSEGVSMKDECSKEANESFCKSKQAEYKELDSKIFK